MRSNSETANGNILVTVPRHKVRILASAIKITTIVSGPVSELG